MTESHPVFHWLLEQPWGSFRCLPEYVLDLSLFSPTTHLRISLCSLKGGLQISFGVESFNSYGKKLKLLKDSRNRPRRSS